MSFHKMMYPAIYNNDPLVLQVAIVTHGSHTLIIYACDVILLTYETFNINPFTVNVPLT